MSAKIDIQDYGPKFHPRYGVEIAINDQVIPEAQVTELSDDPYHLMLSGCEKLLEYLAQKGPEVVVVGERDVLRQLAEDTLIPAYDKWEDREEGGEDDLHYAFKQLREFLEEGGDVE